MTNILFCVCGLGLGHVTRSLSIIKYYVNNKNNRIFIYSEKNVLEFLKNEFPNSKNIILIENKNPYPDLERGKNNLEQTYYMIIDGLNMPKIIKKENKIIQKIIQQNKIDTIISDGIYGAYSEQIPCFLITHQLEFQISGFRKIFGKISDPYNLSIFKKYTKILVLDYKDEKISIAGKLAPSKYRKNKKFVYVGILSQYHKIKTKKDIDYLVIISGYLKEHKQEFYNKLLNVLKKKPGKKVFIMGDYINDYHKQLPGNIEIYSSFKNLDKNKIYNRAKIIVSRTGYSTLMDLVELNKDGILIPTPNCSEQVYLGKYHLNKGYFNIILNQKNINETTFKHNFHNTYLIKNTNLPKTKDSIKLITQTIEKYGKKQ